jgi:hypothetical protein
MLHKAAGLNYVMYYTPMLFGAFVKLEYDAFSHQEYT